MLRGGAWMGTGINAWLLPRIPYWLRVVINGVAMVIGLLGVAYAFNFWYGCGCWWWPLAIATAAVAFLLWLTSG